MSRCFSAPDPPCPDRAFASSPYADRMLVPSTGDMTTATPTAIPFKPRHVSVRREVEAPIAMLEERIHRPGSCRLFLRTAAHSHFGPGHLDAEIRLGPLRRHYTASWVARPGCVEWA